MSEFETWWSESAFSSLVDVKGIAQAAWHEGYSEGFDEGYTTGVEEGYTTGVEEGRDRHR
jgi:flagellar biosynthesis/type III secretory pathway protein FliH